MLQNYLATAGNRFILEVGIIEVNEKYEMKSVGKETIFGALKGFGLSYLVSGFIIFNSGEQAAEASIPIVILFGIVLGAIYWGGKANLKNKDEEQKEKQKKWSERKLIKETYL